MILENIPMELRERMQWLCWRYETSATGKPTKVPYNPASMLHASVTDPSTWVSFQQAVDNLASFDGIGFVLTRSDPYCIIDLDNKVEKPITPDQWALHQRILSTFETYTEKSVSGRGYHIVMRGAVPRGLHRDCVEVYSDMRYMAFTGEVTRNAPIVECQTLLDKMIGQMEPLASIPDLIQIDGKYSDAYICEMASAATNGEKYVALCNGKWKDLGYPSQSEADYALLSMLTFYTLDNAQVLRLFRASALGKRDKATQDDRYLNRGIANIRSKMPQPADLQAAASLAKAVTDAYKEEQAEKLAQPSVSATPTRAEPYTNIPPGLIGQLTQYFYDSAIRPVYEVALSAAICFMAGVVGRQFNISKTGLNQYVLLIAKTGTGKEGAANGINALVSAVRPQVPRIDECIGPGAFASGQGLIKTLDKNKCFVSILGEFGLTLQSLNDPRASASTLLLKRVLLDLYSKSGWHQVLRSTAYSDQEKNTQTVYAPSLSILGESTPEMFYEGINSSDIANGLIPRMQVLEYNGERPPRNRNAGAAPSAELVDRVAAVAARALTMQSNNSCAQVSIESDALLMLDKFDEYCDSKIKNSHGEGETQLWNRAHLKALKLAALLAVGVNDNAPTVTTELADWACKFTHEGTLAIVRKFSDGETGTGDRKQISDVRRLIQEYFAYDKKTLLNYKCDPKLQDAYLVPYNYFTVRALQLSGFCRDARGAARCLKATLDLMVAGEMLNQVDPATALQKFGKRQVLYSIGNSW